MNWEDVKSKIDAGSSDSGLNDLFNGDDFWGSDECVVAHSIGYLYKTGRTVCALNLINNSKLRQFPFSKVSLLKVLYVSGDVFHDLMDYASAINVYTEILDIRECDVAFANRALAFWKTGNVDEALIDYRKAIELNPNNSISLRSIGEMLCENNKFSDAIPYLQSATRLNPKDAIAFRILGISSLVSS